MDTITPTSLPTRAEVQPEHRWDAASVFADDSAWEAAFKEAEERLPALAGYQGRLSESPTVLAAWFDTVFALGRVVGKIYIYAQLFSSVDQADQPAQAKESRAMAFYSRYAAAAAFADPELLAMDPRTLAQWVQDEPRLSIYAHYFDQLARRREHVRSAEVEELLGLAYDPFGTASNIHGTLANAELPFRPAVDSRGGEHEVAQGTIARLLASEDRQLRQTAWESYADGHLAFRSTMANCLAAGIKQDVFYARARRYGSSLEAAVSENHIPTSVFHNLIETFRKNLPTWHRYWEIRRRALGYERLHGWDITAPLSTATPKVDHDQAVEWVLEGLKPLGDEYVAVAAKGLKEQRWVDIYPNKGKRLGAFSTGVKGTHPFIMTNYQDDLQSVSTLAHELGHSMHSYFTWRTQPDVYAGYSIFIAEVASNFNQALVRDYLLRSNPDPAFQIAVIEEAMSNFLRYFFIMPTLARFELETHERAERGEALVADDLIKLTADLFREGYGDGVEVDEERVGITWAEFSTHLYYNFYVYQYATGISGAHALARGVLDGVPDAAERYLSFLRAGASVYPLEAMRMAGVDLESPKPVEETFATFAGMVDRLGQLLDSR